MELFIVDAFTSRMFEGNQAGVVLVGGDDAFPEALMMQKIAAELKYSETAFVKAVGPDAFALRYFTPEGEVELCGHATVSAFTVLRSEKKLGCGTYTAHTPAGELQVAVEAELVWLEMPQGKLIRYLTAEESAALYRAYGLDISAQPAGMQPCIVKVGLADVLLPVSSREQLTSAVQQRGEIVRISEKLQVVGVHMFFYAASLQATAYCRNFAPLYGIDEECATGTSNASLTHYLLTRHHISKGSQNTFVQGEAMGKASVILSRVSADGTIEIGGDAVISVKGWLNL